MAHLPEWAGKILHTKIALPLLNVKIKCPGQVCLKLGQVKRKMNLPTQVWPIIGFYASA